MFPHSNQRAFSGVLVFSALLLSVSGEKVLESRPGMIQDIRTAFADLAREGRAYLGRLAGEQTVLSVQKAFSQVLGVVAGSVSRFLNVLLQYVSQFLQAAEIKGGLPINNVTPAGIIFVARWIFAFIINYFLISLIFRLIASTLRQAMWLLKVVLAVGGFAFILSDHSVGSETIANRLGVLACICVLFGVGTFKVNPADKIAHLEEQVKVLEGRLREMERWRKTEE